MTVAELIETLSAADPKGDVQVVVDQRPDFLSVHPVEEVDARRGVDIVVYTRNAADWAAEQHAIGRKRQQTA